MGREAIAGYRSTSTWPRGSSPASSPSRAGPELRGRGPGGRHLLRGNQNLNCAAWLRAGAAGALPAGGHALPLAGFVSALPHPQRHQAERRHQDGQLEKLMIRIGIFRCSTQCPASIVVACYLNSTIARAGRPRSRARARARTPASHVLSPSTGCSCSSISCASWWASRVRRLDLVRQDCGVVAAASPNAAAAVQRAGATNWRVPRPRGLRRASAALTGRTGPPGPRPPPTTSRCPWHV